MADSGLVGRARRLASCECLDAVRGGTARVVLCGGEPGIGKTRLAEELTGAQVPDSTVDRVLELTAGNPLTR